MAGGRGPHRRDRGRRVLRPATVVVPDGPWSDGTHWWVDSRFTGQGGIPAGRSVESALLLDVLPAVDPSPTDGSTRRRAVVGISMGGAAALRWVLRYPELFGAAVLLSPACYDEQPPTGSSVLTGGAFGVDGSVFSLDAYREQLSWTHLLQRRRPQPRADVAITVGDEEPLQDNVVGGHADLTLEAARLHARLRRHPAMRSTLRIVGGGHEEGLWVEAVVEAAVRAGLGVSAARGGTAG